jgi:hypothetical protein
LNLAASFKPPQAENAENIGPSSKAWYEDAHFLPPERNRGRMRRHSSDITGYDCS